MSAIDVALSLNEWGGVREPDLHDGHLVGVHVQEDKVVDLFLRDVAGVGFQFRLEGVERLRANDFRQGNIILSAELRTGPDITEQDIIDVGAVGSKDEDLRLILERAQEEGLTIFRIDPSYGCTLTALCHGVKVLCQEGPETEHVE